jgi:fructokinase
MTYPIFFDPSTGMLLPLWTSTDVAREQILSIWDQADIIKVSDIELEFLTDESSVQANACDHW